MGGLDVELSNVELEENKLKLWIDNFKKRRIG